MALIDWRQVTKLSLEEAAYLLDGVDPGPLRQGKRMVEGEPSKWTRRLVRAVKAKALPAQRVVVRTFGASNQTREIDRAVVGLNDVLVPGMTLVAVTDLVKWCAASAAPVPLPFIGHVEHSEAGSTLPTAKLPAELQAAIEAFRAVQGDPKATARRSPKAALLKWLESNHPELSANAQERIATVANWQPSGGAPKTPET